MLLSLCQFPQCGIHKGLSFFSFSFSFQHSRPAVSEHGEALPLPDPQHRSLLLRLHRGALRRLLRQRLQESLQDQGEESPQRQRDSDPASPPEPPGTFPFSLFIYTFSPLCCTCFRILPTPSRVTVASWTGSTASTSWPPSSTSTSPASSGNSGAAGEQLKGRFKVARCRSGKPTWDSFQ